MCCSENAVIDDGGLSFCDTAVSPNVQPHPSVWYADGNVVLIAESTSFRVHKSVLARHSEFFHDMFNLPQPPAPSDDDVHDGEDAQETNQRRWEAEDVPVVHTSESADDLAHFLGAIYNSITFVLSISS